MKQISTNIKVIPNSQNTKLILKNRRRRTRRLKDYILQIPRNRGLLKNNKLNILKKLNKLKKSRKLNKFIPKNILIN